MSEHETSLVTLVPAPTSTPALVHGPPWSTMAPSVRREEDWGVTGAGVLEEGGGGGRLHSWREDRYTASLHPGLLAGLWTNTVIKT